MSPPRRSPETTEQLRASLVEHARELIAREGAAGLTMRALAEEAGCAVGLPYKVFADRRDLVLAILHAELDRFGPAFEELVGRAGTGTVGDNLLWFAELILGSPAVPLALEAIGDHEMAKSVADRAHAGGVGPLTFEAVLARYVAAEKAAGRVRDDVDEDAIAFLLAGALHNLIVAGAAWPRPTQKRLQRLLESLADAIS